MWTDWNALAAVPPAELEDARNQAHYAAQWPSRAARANLPARDDDSHSNLGWDNAARALTSHDLPGDLGAPIRVAVDVEQLLLFVARGPEWVGALELDGRADADVGAWLDATLAQVGLAPASAIVSPYEIPEHAIAKGGLYAKGDTARLAALARWFSAAADVLGETNAKLADLAPGPSPIRCWPHHFDIDFLLSLADGDSGGPRSIGVG